MAEARALRHQWRRNMLRGEPVSLTRLINLNRNCLVCEEVCEKKLRKVISHRHCAFPAVWTNSLNN